MNSNQKYFNVLGIAPTSDKTVIKKAYRRLAFKYHPDKNQSPTAQAKFIEITDAYEIAIGFKKVPLHNVTEQNENSAPTKDERVKAAKDRYQKAKQKELEVEATYYFNLINGAKWRFIKWSAFFCTLLSVLLVIDIYLPVSLSSLIIEEYFVDNSLNHIFFSIDSSTYYFNYEDGIEISKYPMINVVKTPIFNDVKFVSLLNDEGMRLRVYPVFSVTSLFPLVSLILMIPIGTLWYNRPDPLFTLLHMISVYFVPIIFGFSLISNWRFFQIFM